MKKSEPYFICITQSGKSEGSWKFGPVLRLLLSLQLILSLQLSSFHYFLWPKSKYLARSSVLNSCRKGCTLYIGYQIQILKAKNALMLNKIVHESDEEHESPKLKNGIWK